MVGTSRWRGGLSLPTLLPTQHIRCLAALSALALSMALPAHAGDQPAAVAKAPFVKNPFVHINFDALAAKSLPVKPSRFEASRSTIHEAMSNPKLKSTEGQPIPLWTVTSPDISESVSAILPASGEMNRQRFLIQGGLHGNEVATSKFVRWLFRRVSAGISPLNNLPGNFAIDFVPYANPDRFGKSRYNANYVNLNRNFGAFWGRSFEPNGSGPFSEKETHAIRKLMSSKPYVAAVDVHGYAKWIVAPSQNPKGHTLADWQVDRYQRWRQALKGSMESNLPGYKLISALGLGDGGAFEDWSFWHNDTLAFCLEMSSAKRFVKEKSDLVDTFPRYEQFIFDMFSRAVSFQSQVTLAGN